MRANKATLYHGNATLELDGVDLSATKAVFDAPRDVAARFVRLTFKLYGQWFDVEGVAMMTGPAGAKCRCEMGFAALPANTAHRLTSTLSDTPGPSRPDVSRKKSRRVATPLPAA